MAVFHPQKWEVISGQLRDTCIAGEVFVKLYIDRTICDHSLPACERCLGRLLRFPMGEDRPCITAIEDDNRPELELTLTSDGRTTTLVLDDAMRELAAFEGFSAFLPWTPAFYRTEAN